MWLGKSPENVTATDGPKMNYFPLIFLNREMWHIDGRKPAKNRKKVNQHISKNSDTFEKMPCHYTTIIIITIISSAKTCESVSTLGVRYAMCNA